MTLARKSNGEYRLCVDYRELNKLVVPMARPIPHVEDLLLQSGQKHYFTRIDLKDAFFHVFVENESIKYLAFITSSGQFEFLVAPFGFRNSPLVFAEFISYIFRDLIRAKKILIFLMIF